MKFELTQLHENEKSILSNLMQFYTYELSFYEDETTHFNMEDTGFYKLSKYLDLYGKEETRHAYLLRVDDKIAGFVLERYNEEGKYEIAEFFVLPKFRKKGAGTYMANKMFGTYHGNWEIRTLLKNKKAQAFWRNVVSKVSNGKLKEGFTCNGTRYVFYFEN